MTTDVTKTRKFTPFRVSVVAGDFSGNSDLIEPAHLDIPIYSLDERRYRMLLMWSGADSVV